jgi:hypothetical protein
VFFQVFETSLLKEVVAVVSPNEAAQPAPAETPVGLSEFAHKVSVNITAVALYGFEPNHMADEFPDTVQTEFEFETTRFELKPLEMFAAVPAGEIARVALPCKAPVRLQFDARVFIGNPPPAGNKNALWLVMSTGTAPFVGSLSNKSSAFAKFTLVSRSAAAAESAK